MDEIYLDNAATTRVLPEVISLMSEVMGEDYGNPSSLHSKGFAAEKRIREAKESIARTLHADEKSIIFTSGGTESNNQALIGTAFAYARQGKHIITTAYEHPSVHEPLIWLESQGYEVTYLPVESDGHPDPDRLRSALRPDTILVSVMMVNNEIGAIQDIASLAKIVKEYSPDIRFHTDAIQAYGKLPIYPKRLGIDLMSVSGHKLHGPKGVGFLYVDGGKLGPYIHGGHQQKNMRSGTENVPGIAGFGLAARLACTDIDRKRERVAKLSNAFIKNVTRIEDVVVHGRECDIPASEANTGYEDTYSPYIISLGVRGVRAEVLLHALEEKGIYVSSGSACSTNHPGISDTLTAIGVGKDYLDSTIRISLSGYTTEEELDAAAKALGELIPVLRRFTRR